MSNAIEPPRRDTNITTVVPADLAERVRAKAMSKGRTLSGLLRSFLYAWDEGIMPDPPMRPDENVRARKRARKRRKEK